MIALALEWGAERIEVAHTQYYGWGLKNRAALLPTRAQFDAASAAVAAAQSAAHAATAIGLLNKATSGLMSVVSTSSFQSGSISVM
mgnify:CR=1 FL=1